MGLVRAGFSGTDAGVRWRESAFEGKQQLSGRKLELREKECWAERRSWKLGMCSMRWFGVEVLKLAVKLPSGLGKSSGVVQATQQTRLGAEKTRF